MCRQDIELGFVFIDDQIRDSLALFFRADADDICRRGFELDACDLDFSFGIVRQEFATHESGVNLSEPVALFFSYTIQKQIPFKLVNSVDKLEGEKLMEETFRASDLITRQRRVTYDTVVKTFLYYYKRLLGGNGKTEALEAFGHGIGPLGTLPDFDKTTQFMLGGDEIFVAADPRYTKFIPDIIDALDGATFENKPLNLRTAVTFSSAERVTGPPEQKRKNQEAHDQAMQLAGAGPGPLKEFERTHRRIEMLIEKLQANPKKEKQAPAFTKDLAKLPLTRVYAQIKYRRAKRLADQEFARLLRLLREGTPAQAGGSIDVEFVDFDGKVVDGVKLTTDAAALEKKVRDAVGWDNRHVDGPPMTKMPKIIKWLEDILKQPWPPRANS